MSCHNFTRCGIRSASHTPRRSRKKKTVRKSFLASSDTASSSGRKSSNDSTSDTFISRSAPLSKSGPLFKSESRRSTTIMFSQSSGLLKPPAIEKHLECTLEELCLGTNKKMKVTRVVVKDTGQMAQEEELVTINVKPGWKRETKITFQALTGCTMSVPLLGGENMNLNVEDTIYPGYEITVPDQGMPISVEDGKRGNLKVNFLVEFPTFLTNEQRSKVRTILEDS